MTGHMCCAYNCQERQKKGGISFHYFPKDPERRKIWTVNLRRKNFIPKDHTKICGKHFEEDCFDREKFGGRWLKPTAVPTIFDYPPHLQIKKTSREPSSERSSPEIMAEAQQIESEQNSNVLEFLMMIGKLKHIKRTGWVRSNVPNCETIAGHMYRMSVMAFLLGDQISSDLDRNKCIKMALVHDMAECIVGDITPFCGVSAEEKHSREVSAMTRLSALVGEKAGAEFLSLFMEYEEKQTAESKFVHDLDKFDMILQAYEYEKESNNTLDLQQFFNSTEGIFQNPMVLQWVAELKDLRRQSVS